MTIKYDFDSPVVDSSHWDAGAEINAIFRDHDNVRVAGDWLWVRSQIRQAPYKEIYASNPTNLLKDFNGDMIIMEKGGFQSLRGINLEGQVDAGRTGGLVYVEAGGGWQKFERVRVVRSADPCVKMHQPHAGHAASFTNCELIGTPTMPAVDLPLDEPTTGGLRRFISCKGGGGMSIRWNGAKTSMMAFCDTFGFSMNEASMYGVFISNRFAIVAATLPLKGLEHSFQSNITSSRVLISTPGTWYDGSNTDAGVDYAFPRFAAASKNELEKTEEQMEEARKGKERIAKAMVTLAAEERKGEQKRHKRFIAKVNASRHE